MTTSSSQLLRPKLWGQPWLSVIQYISKSSVWLPRYNQYLATSPYFWISAQVLPKAWEWTPTSRLTSPPTTLLPLAPGIMATPASIHQAHSHPGPLLHLLPLPGRSHLKDDQLKSLTSFKSFHKSHLFSDASYDHPNNQAFPMHLMPPILMTPNHGT